MLARTEQNAAIDAKQGNAGTGSDKQDRSAQRHRNALSNFLVASARTGDRRAWDKLFRLWQPRFLAHSWRLTGDKEMACDATQSAWSDIYSSLNRLSDDRAFAIWAYRIISRKCAKAIGRKVRRAELTRLTEEPQQNDLPPDDHIALDQAIAQLPGGQRAALALFYRDGMHIAEIAIALDVPEGTVKSRLNTARKRLRDIFTANENPTRVKENKNG